MTVAEREWLTIAEVCAILQVTRATLYRWARQGKLRLYKLGARATRVRRADLDRMLEPANAADAWAKLSEASFVRDWDNEKDASYDNWREIYGVRQG
ncbi:MAG: helix-turn-helix domain-containing protein [Dehalococcoidia bacterium]|nr:helix-turn-helix domain-containing protein [Dehalococcoidia bacterium]